MNAVRYILGILLVAASSLAWAQTNSSDLNLSGQKVAAILIVLAQPAGTALVTGPQAQQLYENMNLENMNLAPLVSQETPVNPQGLGGSGGLMSDLNPTGFIAPLPVQGTHLDILGSRLTQQIQGQGFSPQHIFGEMGKGIYGRNLTIEGATITCEKDYDRIAACGSDANCMTEAYTCLFKINSKIKDAARAFLCPKNSANKFIIIMNGQDKKILTSCEVNGSSGVTGKNDSIAPSRLHCNRDRHRICATAALGIRG